MFRTLDSGRLAGFSNSVAGILPELTDWITTNTAFQGYPAKACSSSDGCNIALRFREHLHRSTMPPPIPALKLKATCRTILINMLISDIYHSRGATASVIVLSPPTLLIDVLSHEEHPDHRMHIMQQPCPVRHLHLDRCSEHTVIR